MTKQLDIYEVLGHEDTTEGRGGMKVVARFTNRAEAQKVLNDPRHYGYWGVMGHKIGDMGVRQAQLEVFETAEEYWTNVEQTKVMRALHKLNSEEIAVLQRHFKLNP